MRDKEINQTEKKSFFWASAETLNLSFHIEGQDKKSGWINRC